MIKRPLNKIKIKKMESEEELCIRYMPLIETHILHTKIRYSNRKNIDYDDLYSDLQLALLKAIRTYKKNKKTSMKTWIMGYLIGYTLNYFRDNKEWLNNTYQLSNLEPRKDNIYYTSDYIEREIEEKEREGDK